MEIKSKLGFVQGAENHFESKNSPTLCKNEKWNKDGPITNFKEKLFSVIKFLALNNNKNEKLNEKKKQILQFVGCYKQNKKNSQINDVWCVSIANKQDVSVYFSYLPLLLLLLPDMYLFLSVMMMTFYGKNGFANSICFIQNTNKHTYISYFEQKIHIWNTADLMMMEQQLRQFD